MGNGMAISIQLEDTEKNILRLRELADVLECKIYGAIPKEVGICVPTNNELGLSERVRNTSIATSKLCEDFSNLIDAL